MAALSDYLEQQLLNAILRGGTYTGGPVYAALFTSDPTDAGTGDEVADSGYARQVCHSASPADGWDVPDETGGFTNNAKLITFPAIIDAPVTVTHWALFDAETGGNLLLHSPLENPKTLDPSDVLALPLGTVEVTLS